ncbi:MAG: prepilin-type N-terminal cleavage/methylation domain-containing protein [Gammaproteobacteria bacterium]|nr:prepilin-type N-terminal cleavage/methylation domain-containing protein [Gammaproteobacteria bacterium]
MKKTSGKKPGFSLVELLAVITIAGILASFAIPAYYSFLQRGYVADATSSLTRLANQLESSFLDSRNYANAQGQCAVPTDDTSDYFDIQCAITGQGLNQYLLSATTTARFDQEKTYVYSLDNNGRRQTRVFINNSETAHHECWLVSNNGACI